MRKFQEVNIDVEHSSLRPRHTNYFDGIDRSGKVFYREQERQTFNFAMSALENAQEEAWNKMPESIEDKYKYIMENVQSIIIKRINDEMAVKSFSIATKNENKKLYEKAATKLSSYMVDDELIMACDNAIVKCDFKSGFAIGYKRIYFAKDTKRNQIFTVEFQNIEKLIPNPSEDQFLVNGDLNLKFHYLNLPIMVLAIALVIVKSYIDHGPDYNLKLE